MRMFFVLVALTLFALVPGRDAVAGDDLLISKKSPYSVAETLDRLDQVLTSKGVTVFARVDHAAGAAKVDQKLPATELLIFGNPKMGTPLMTSDRRIGIDLPMKALAWEDGDGQVWLSYTAPSALKARFGIGDRDPVFEKMTGALDNLTNAALKK